MASDFIAADTCPYCGNHEVAPHRFEGVYEPDALIPFAITKTRALELYEDYLKGKEFVSEDYVANDRIVSVQGTYVPFWLLDGDLRFDYNFETRIYQKDTSDTFHRHRKVGTYAFSQVPADTSEHMPDDMMDSMEPFDYGALVPFSTEYLPGFIAERHTVNVDAIKARADKRLTLSTCAEARDTIEERYDSVTLDQDDFLAETNFTGITQVLLPVWLLVIAYGDKEYLVGVNGQTGKVAGNLPVDERKRQRKAVREIPHNLMLLAPLWVGAVLGMAYCVFDAGGFGPMLRSIGDWASDSPTSNEAAFVDAVLFLLMLLGMGALVGFLLHGFSKATKQSVTESVHDVDESINTRRYGTMTITESTSSVI